LLCVANRLYLELISKTVFNRKLLAC